MTTLKQYVQYVLESPPTYWALTANKIPHEEVLYLYKKFDDEGKENTRKVTKELLMEFQNDNSTFNKNYLHELKLLDQYFDKIMVKENINKPVLRIIK